MQGRSVGVPVLTDVHSPDEAAAAAEVVDVVQVPALLSRQTDLLVACGKTGKAVNIKKGQFISPEEMAHAIAQGGIDGEHARYSSPSGGRASATIIWSIDFRALPIMREFGYPVIFDATHSVQLPGGAGASSAGEREFVFPLARAAVAVGDDGVFMEVHEDPDQALCDGENSVCARRGRRHARVLKRIREAL